VSGEQVLAELLAIIEMFGFNSERTIE